LKSHIPNTINTNEAKSQRIVAAPIHERNMALFNPETPETIDRAAINQRITVKQDCFIGAARLA
jgi:hypothetical protein